MRILRPYLYMVWGLAPFRNHLNDLITGNARHRIKALESKEKEETGAYINRHNLLAPLAAGIKIGGLELNRRQAIIKLSAFWALARSAFESFKFNVPDFTL